MKRLSLVFLLCCSSFIWAQSLAYSTTKGVVAVEKENTVLAFLKDTNEHNTLLKAIEASGLQEILSGNGPFTILAPTDTAFEKLAKNTLKTLFLSENQERLKAIITYHVIPGNINTATISKAISDNNGEADLKTLNGSTIAVFIKEGLLVIEDAKGKEALIETPDKQQSNGYVHIVDAVILPNETY